jgi:hypothetical protein
MQVRYKNLLFKNKNSLIILQLHGLHWLLHSTACQPSAFTAAKTIEAVA